MISEENRNKLIQYVHKTIVDNGMFDLKGFGKVELNTAIKLAEEKNQIFYWFFTINNEISISTNNRLLNHVLEHYVTQLNLGSTITDNDKKDVCNTLREIHQNALSKVLAMVAKQNDNEVNKQSVLKRPLL